jgi:3-oxoacyl-[acyl-carrier-protein] synthase II
MKAYIKGIGSISPQPGFGNNAFNKSISYSDGTLRCVEPDYSEWIDERAIRRMSKIIRIGVAAASLALKEAGIQKPDAIVTGTGLGCLEDTGGFLNKLIANKEEALNPTPFIQSTHNTIGSQIALLLQCLGYNQTYTQRAHSFEHALQDSLMMLRENPEQNILVGGVDEVTDISADLLKKLGLSSECSDSLRMFNQKRSGTVYGEGSSFFVLNNSSVGAWAEIVGVSAMYKPENGSEVKKQLEALMHTASISKDEIDLILLGKCGDEKYDYLMDEVSREFSSETLQGVFKNLCGEYSTASSFAMWLAAMILKKSFIPEGMSSNGRTQDKPIKLILIYNQYLNQYHSLILLKACDE